MPRYHVSGTALESNVPFPELQPQPRIKFQLCATPPPAVIAAWRERRDEQNQPWLAIAKVSAGFVLRFAGQAEFHVSAHGQKIFCYPSAHVSAETIRHLLLDHVLPLLFSQRGKIVLHAGAVVTPSGAIAFTGASGQGKSTLTLYFAQQGFPVLTDDFLQLEIGAAIFGSASYPGLRLFPQQMNQLFAAAPLTTAVADVSEKRRLALDHAQMKFHPAPAQMRKIFLLEEADEIQVVPLAPRFSFIEFVKNSFHLDLENLAYLHTMHESITQLAAANLLYRLRYPRTISALPQVRDAILAALKNTATK